MAQQGITFDKCNVTSANDAHYHWTFLNHTNGVTKGCAVTAGTKTFTIAKGYFIIYGRMVQVTGAETINVTLPTSSGTTYGMLVYTIDLTKTNTVGDFQQGYFEVLTNASKTPTPTQQDLDNNGTKYQMPFATFTMTSSGIGNFKSVINSINFTDLYTELTKQRKEYVSILDDYLDQFKEAGFLETATYQNENTPVSITVTKANWTQGSDGLWTCKKACSKATASDKCQLRIWPYLTTFTKDAKRNMDRAVSYIFPEPTITAGYITFKAYAQPQVTIYFRVAGGDGT